MENSLPPEAAQNSLGERAGRLFLREASPVPAVAPARGILFKCQLLEVWPITSLPAKFLQGLFSENVSRRTMRNCDLFLDIYFVAMRVYLSFLPFI